jgi:hypothetical protein
MPTFGPGHSVGLMLCPAYAPSPVAISSPASRGGKDSAAGAPTDMSAMAMSMEMPAHQGQSVDQSPQLANASTPTGGSVPLHGSIPSSGSEHQEHTLCPYAASATLAAPPADFSFTAREQATTEFALLTAQIAYFRLAPRAQSARAPPLDPELTKLAA